MLAELLPVFLVVAALPVIALIVPSFARADRRVFVLSCVVAGLFVGVAATFTIGGLIYLPVALLALASLVGAVPASRGSRGPGIIARVASAAAIGAGLWLVGALMAMAQGVWPPTVPRVILFDALFVFCALLFGWCAYHLYRARAVDSLIGRLCFGLGTAGSFAMLGIVVHYFAADPFAAIGWPPTPATVMLIAIASVLLVAPLLVPRRAPAVG